MYDMTKLVPRHFKIKLKNNKIIEVEPPKLKVLKKILKLSSIKSNSDLTEQDFENITIATSMALSKNKQNYEVAAKWLEDNHNIDELQNLLLNYFSWVNEIEDSKN